MNMKFLLFMVASPLLAQCFVANNWAHASPKTDRVSKLTVVSETNKPDVSAKIEKPKLRLSPMVENMAVSKTIEIHALTKEMGARGETVYSLCVGEPDYQPPSEVVEATAAAAREGNTKYTAVGGEAKLREAICDDLAARKGVTYKPEQIVVANGAKQSVIQSLLTVVCPGDDVLLVAPYWPSYPDMVKMCGANPVTVNTTPEDGYSLRPEALRETLSAHPKVSCMILCNPSNPTGCVMDEDELDGIAQVLREFPEVFVVSDEIYEQLCYEKPARALATYEGMYDRTLTINGFSKSHSMTGYRLGYSASSVGTAKAISKLQSQMTSSASSISQAAALTALEKVSPSWIEERRGELKEKRDFAYDLLMKIPNIKCPKPTGAFYLLPDVSHYFGGTTEAGRSVANSHEMCLELLREEKVALVSGDAFGADNCIRLSYATSFDTIEQAVVRLGKFLASLKHQ